MSNNAVIPSPLAHLQFHLFAEAAPAPSTFQLPRMLHLRQGGGGAGMRSPGLAKNAGKCGKNMENAAKMR